MKYVAGFVFNEDASRVLLIHKQKPDWQLGKFNGVGGKIRRGESPVQAMTRECNEEAGLLLRGHRWKEFCVLQGDGFVVHFFNAFVENNIFDHAKSATAEAIHALPVGLVEQIN